jgi:hypothetical protein
MTSRAIAPTSNGKKAFSRLDIPIIVPGVMAGTGTTAIIQPKKTDQDSRIGATGWT